MQSKVSQDTFQFKSDKLYVQHLDKGQETN